MLLFASHNHTPQHTTTHTRCNRNHPQPHPQPLPQPRPSTRTAPTHNAHNRPPPHIPLPIPPDSYLGLTNSKGILGLKSVLYNRNMRVRRFVGEAVVKNPPLDRVKPVSTPSLTRAALHTARHPRDTTAVAAKYERSPCTHTPYRYTHAPWSVRIDVPRLAPRVRVRLA